ncbi:hypothetical protein M431DRAFT_469080 [Trichoderma harzianum CBS 226.95]|uniref:Secreted protein n=1 Tax=Trichoderma harzianum CBS 226.95 TaxID=983964 RepID=A0A2T4A6H9_TRIHA|nr:hypothetical protein M431DRAFT_469080 [Trichoderma harzianum CBS 226.95]PTB52670.1 hypothetical protein M431DRAFT_469080 [Trichoderma harzianum CBS 226.95]
MLVAILMLTWGDWGGTLTDSMRRSCHVPGAEKLETGNSNLKPPPLKKNGCFVPQKRAIRAVSFAASPAPLEVGRVYYFELRREAKALALQASGFDRSPCQRFHSSCSPECSPKFPRGEPKFLFFPCFYQIKVNTNR